LERVLPELAGMLDWPLAEHASADPVQIAEPPEGVLALLLAHWPAGAPRRSLLHVARSETRAERIARAVRSFATGCEVLLLPPWDCLPSKSASRLLAMATNYIGVYQRLVDEAVSPQGRAALHAASILLPATVAGEEQQPAAWLDQSGVGGSRPV
jgi:transcription-repair coupling factor (superfamily II helicase)